MNKIYVYDLEIFKNFFSGIFLDPSNNVHYEFVIHKDRNDLNKFLKFLGTVRGLIGFNNINFDAQLIEFLLTVSKHEKDPEVLTDLLYNFTQDEVLTEGFPPFAPFNLSIPNLDLYKIHHFDNKAKRTSLKMVAVVLKWPKIQDLPLSPHSYVSKDQIDEILKYNLNDVLITNELYKKTLDKIKLRKKIQQEYGIKCMNYSDTKIGSELMLKLYCEKTGLSRRHVKELRTYRKNIKLKDCIFDYIQFKSREFQELLEDLKSRVIVKTKGAYKEKVNFRGLEYHYGTGGIHGCIDPGVYTEDEDHVIIDSDIGSQYPNIAIQNRLYPKHLGEDFIDIYKNEIVDVRMKAKKEGNMIVSDSLKLAANSVYGNSNNKYSFLYDPKYTITTTINGQLLITMLAENLVLSIPGLTMLQINTDGLTVKIKKEYESLYYELGKKWEKLTGLELEHAKYEKMIIRDVNSYIAKYKNNNKVKHKGAFEIDKDLHKNPSMRAVRIALSNYFIENKEIKDTFEECDILDFAKVVRVKSKGTKIVEECEKEKEELQKTVRYYVSTDGCDLIKIMPPLESQKTATEKHKEKVDPNQLDIFEIITDDITNKIRRISVEANNKCTVLNDYDEEKNYNNVEKDYYIEECYKIINKIEKRD